jgi:DNA-directed RNA polymerase specialized sigma24 family protein
MPTNKEVTQVPASSPTTQELLLALVALEIDRREREQADGQVKTELLLSGAGLGYQQVAKIMGKSADAVRMTISRAKPKNGKRIVSGEYRNG